ncbi:MAG: hypothetical protein FJZ56_00895 [Chlamydiae bacterium]|nr:hypothetical protein [Chlamydiota bacterium]
MSIAFNANVVSIRSEGNMVGNLLSDVGSKPTLVLKTTQTACGWAEFAGACIGSSSSLEAANTASKIGSACNLGAKINALPDGMNSLGSCINAIPKIINSAEKVQNSEDGAVKALTTTTVGAVENLAKATSSAGEFAEALAKMQAFVPDTFALGIATQSAKIVADVAGIVGSVFKIIDISESSGKVEQARADGNLTPNQESIHEMKVHESWLSMVKNVGGLALHVISILAIALGVAILNPVVLVIGTAVLITSIALYFISDNRKAAEQSDIIHKINVQLAS